MRQESVRRQSVRQERGRVERAPAPRHPRWHAQARSPEQSRKQSRKQRTGEQDARSKCAGRNVGDAVDGARPDVGAAHGGERRRAGSGPGEARWPDRPAGSSAHPSRGAPAVAREQPRHRARALRAGDRRRPGRRGDGRVRPAALQQLHAQPRRRSSFEWLHTPLGDQSGGGGSLELGHRLERGPPAGPRVLVPVRVRQDQVG